MRTLKLFLPLIGIMLLSSCATFQGDHSTEISSSVQTLLIQSAQSTTPEEAQQYEVLAVNQLLDDQNINDAEQLLQQINRQPITSMVAPQKAIVEAELALTLRHPHAAIAQLASVKKVDMLPLPLQSTYYETQIEAYVQSNDLANSILARIHFDNIINDESLRQQNEMIIWHSLQTLSTSSLTALQTRATSPFDENWIKLAIIAKQNANNPTSLIKQLLNWQTQNPGHPANQFIPDSDSLTQLASSYQTPKKIALLLPLQGNYGNMGKAVRDGFMTAFYENAANLAINPSLKVYDTTQTNDIKSLYQQAIQEGANFIIGPLTKTNVNAIADSGDTNVPTVLLNYADESLPKNMYEMGFAPAEAARQAANLAWQHNGHDLLLIYPNDSRSQDIANAFKQQWLQLGGRILNEIQLDNTQPLSSEIATAVNVSLSRERADELKQLLDEKIKATLRRRQDIDGIFLLSTPAEARQILPLLKFYYAGNLPVFSITTVYSGYPSPDNDHDLNGLYFDDMPFVISNTPAITNMRNKIVSLWRNNYRQNNRLYALGIDAYTLSFMLPRLLLLPTFAVNGVTGLLFLQQQSIYQSLSWVQFQSGTPVMLNK